MLGQDPVALLCESCGRTLDRWKLDEQRGQLRPTTRGEPRGAGPPRAGHPQALAYRCPSKTCRRDVVLGFGDLERAVLEALREGRRTITVGADLRGRYAGESVRTTTVRAKAPIPGGYRRPSWWPADE